MYEEAKVGEGEGGDSRGFVDGLRIYSGLVRLFFKGRLANDFFLFYEGSLFFSNCIVFY